MRRHLNLTTRFHPIDARQITLAARRLVAQLCMKLIDRPGYELGWLTLRFRYNRTLALRVSLTPLAISRLPANCRAMATVTARDKPPHASRVRCDQSTWNALPQTIMRHRLSEINSNILQPPLVPGLLPLSRASGGTANSPAQVRSRETGARVVMT